MPADFWTDAVQMVTAGAIVAAVALPVGLVAWVTARRRGEPLLPAPKPWRVPWGGFEIIFAFLILTELVPKTLRQFHVLPLAVPVIAFPIELAILVLAARLLYPKWRVPPGGSIASRITLAAVTWVVLTPVVLALHVAVLQVYAGLGWQPDEHPLTQMGGGTAVEQVLFALQACVAAPFVEEVLCRGLLLPWVIGARERNHGGPANPVATPVYRPWLVLAFAGFPVAASGKIGPPILLAVFAAGLGVIWVTVRRGRRHVRGVYATAAFFALIHSNIWPTPIPLFVLGLGLGWLAVRTRGVVAPIIVHGLFNAVATIQVLRGGAG